MKVYTDLEIDTAYGIFCILHVGMLSCLLRLLRTLRVCVLNLGELTRVSRNFSLRNEKLNCFWLYVRRVN